MRPRASRACAAARSSSPSRVTSQASTSARRPFFISSAATASRRSVRRAASATSAPRRANSRASAAPMPDEAPVMNATRPAKVSRLALERSVEERGAALPGVLGGVLLVDLRPVVGEERVRRAGIEHELHVRVRLLELGLELLDILAREPGARRDAGELGLRLALHAALAMEELGGDGVVAGVGEAAHDVLVLLGHAGEAGDDDDDRVAPGRFRPRLVSGDLRPRDVELDVA